MKHARNRWRLCVRAFGTVLESYTGMCGAVTTVKRRYIVAEIKREWICDAVAHTIERFMKAVRGTWPDWLPPQEPIVETYFYHT